MRNFMRYMILISGILFGCFTLPAAINAAPKEQTAQRGQTTTKTETLTLQVTETRPLLSFKDMTKAKLVGMVCTSGNKKVVTVDKNGVVTAKKRGTAEVVIKIPRLHKMVRVKIKVVFTPVTRVKLAETSVQMVVGETYSPKITVKPKKASIKKLEFTSSNPDVAVVDAYGVVTAVSDGKAKIRAKATDGSGKSAVCQITVIGEMKRSEVHFVAHRGLSSKAPENTRLAFRMAGEAGFYGLESDVRITADGEFIMSHDRNFSRMCGVNQNVDSLTLADIQNMQILLPEEYTAYSGNADATEIASLDEYLDICLQYGMTPFIDVKMNYRGDNLTPSAIRLTKVSKDTMETLFYKVAEKMGDSEVHFVSKDREVLDTFLDLIAENDRPNMTVLHINANIKDHNLAYYLQTYEETGMGLFARKNAIQKAQVDVFAEHGIKTGIWTVNNQVNAWKFLKHGAEYIVTEQELWTDKTEQEE